ncbi:MAG: hypothetical protein V2I62_00880 [Bacteroidales bacterium]|jgi:hypothetical protein|nr:hypothetical protein [Bacteroidales bacterium]
MKRETSMKKLLLIAFCVPTVALAEGAVVCDDVYDQIDKSVNEFYKPLILENAKKIARLKKKGLDPCNYYDVTSDKTINYCEIERNYKSLEDTVADEAKDSVKCFENNTEVTTQAILGGINELAVKFTSEYLGVTIPEKAFYIDIIDMEKDPLGGKNSLYNNFKDQAEAFKK